jgi:hypothetical protein
MSGKLLDMDAFTFCAASSGECNTLEGEFAKGPAHARIVFSVASFAVRQYVPQPDSTVASHAGPNLLDGDGNGLGIEEVHQIRAGHPQELSRLSGREDVVVGLHSHSNIRGQVGDQAFEALARGSGKRHVLAIIAAHEDRSGLVKGIGEKSKLLQLFVVGRNDKVIGDRVSHVSLVLRTAASLAI